MNVDVFVNDEKVGSVAEDMAVTGDVELITDLIGELTTTQELLDRYHSPPYVWVQPARA